MRQIFTFLLIFALSTINAQIFSENFDNGVPGGMTQEFLNGTISWEPCGGDTGGATCPINGSGSATFYSNTLSPFATVLKTPVMDLSNGVYKVSYKLANRAKNDKINQFYLEISTNGGTSWSIVHSELNAVNEPTYFTHMLNSFSLNENTQIRIRARNRGGHRTILDDVMVTHITSDDINLQSLDLSPVLLPGATEIKGRIVNEGVNPITTFDLNWQIDGGEIVSQTVSEVYIPSGEVFDFTHNQPWNATSGNHSVKVWVSNSNVTDVNSDNNELTQSVMVASGSVHKLPFMEKFSSSTCYPCYLFNTNAFNTFYANYGEERAAFLSYQVNWPGSGDPYYTSEVGNRVSYYSVNAAPSLYINADEIGIGGATSSSLENLLANIIANDHISFFKIDADHSISGDNISIDVNITPYISGNYNLQVMVFEKKTTQNVATNGETEFHHVFMKALPNAQGTAMNFIQDQVETMNFTYDMSTTNVEEMDDLGVVIFIQDNPTKNILQSGYTISTGIEMGVTDFSGIEVAMVPNPTTGLLKIITTKAVDIQLFDLTGKSVFLQSNVLNNSSINLSYLSKGIYLVSFVDQEGNRTVKRLIKN
jgi:hypothetical protein